MKLITLNVELNKHFNRFIPFLKKWKPEVLLLQEIWESDAIQIASELNLSVAHAPMQHLNSRRSNRFGVALLSKTPLVNSKVFYYGDFNDETDINYHNRGGKLHCALLVGKYENQEGIFTVSTTHGTFNPSHQASALQCSNITRLIDCAREYKDIIIAGDMNMVRGELLWETMCKHFTDNIPKAVTCTLDFDLHRIAKEKNLHFVVDGIFSTSGYTIQNVTTKFGLSDHCAILADAYLIKP